MFTLVRYQEASLPAGPNPYGICLDQVVHNATAEGIDLSEIGLLYRNLSDHELTILQKYGLYADRSAETIRGRFTKEGLVLYPEKVSSLLHL